MRGRTDTSADHSWHQNDQYEPAGMYNGTTRQPECSINEIQRDEGSCVDQRWDNKRATQQ